MLCQFGELRGALFRIVHADRDERDRYGDNDPKEPEIVDVVAFQGSRVTGCGKANPEIAEKQRDLRSSMPGGGL